MEAGRIDRQGKLYLHLSLEVEQGKKRNNRSAGSFKQPGIYIIYKAGAKQLLRGGKMGRLVCLLGISFQDWYLRSDLEKLLTKSLHSGHYMDYHN